MTFSGRQAEGRTSVLHSWGGCRWACHGDQGPCAGQQLLERSTRSHEEWDSSGALLILLCGVALVGGSKDGLFHAVQCCCFWVLGCSGYAASVWHSESAAPTSAAKSDFPSFGNQRQHGRAEPSHFPTWLMHLSSSISTSSPYGLILLSSVEVPIWHCSVAKLVLFIQSPPQYMCCLYFHHSRRSFGKIQDYRLCFSDAIIQQQ